MSVACSILIPAHNEVGYIEPCLEALLASDGTGAQVEVIVMAQKLGDNDILFRDQGERRLSSTS